MTLTRLWIRHHGIARHVAGITGLGAISKGWSICGITAVLEMSSCNRLSRVDIGRRHAKEYCGVLTPWMVFEAAGIVPFGALM
jgi:hypothetical protein